VLWGSEGHVRKLFGDRLGSLELTRRHYVESSAGGPGAYCDLFKQAFGPVVGLYASLADRPDALAALDRDFMEFAVRSNQGPPGGPAETATSTCSSSAADERRRGAERPPPQSGSSGTDGSSCLPSSTARVMAADP
jgi:hypothetical protein